MAEENNNQNSGENQEEKNQFKAEEDMDDNELKQLAEDEDFILNFKDEDYGDPEKAEKLEKALKNAKTTIHQKRHYRSKFQEASKKGNDHEKPAGTEKKDKTNAPAAETGDDKTALIEFRQDYPEVPKTVAKEILDYAKFHRISADEAMKRGTIKALIKESTNKKEVDDAGIEPKKGAAGTIAEKDWSGASESEIQAMRAKMGQE